MAVPINGEEEQSAKDVSVNAPAKTFDNTFDLLV